MRDRLIEALDALSAPVSVFIRDDDAGWDDARLLALLDTTQAAGVPIDLAVIPQSVSRALARELNARHDTQPGLVDLHQHGLAHANHEAEGRKCEFGAARDAATQRADLQRGRDLMRTHFGARAQPIFTPPWNRVAAHTPALLAELGFLALSRDRAARPAQQALTEIAVDVDWSKHWRTGGADAVACALAAALLDRAADAQPLGLMLHHAAMGADEIDTLTDLLRGAARHPYLRWRPMSALLPSEQERTGTACTTPA